MKKRGHLPNPKKPEIVELLKAGMKPAKIVIALGCTIWAVRYVKRTMRRRKGKQ